MKTGAIQAGIGSLVKRMEGRERWLIPVLMSVFALGGTSYGMAEESLAFYALVITVLIAAGYDALTGAAVVLLGCGIGVIGSTVNPFATGIASGIAGVSISDGPHRAAGDPDRRPRDRNLLRPPLRRPRQEGPDEVGRLRPEGGERGTLPGPGRRRRDHAHGHAQGDPCPVRARLPRDDLRGHPLGGPRDRDPHPLVVVPGDDRFVPPVLDHHRAGRPAGRGRADLARSSTARATCSGLP